MKPRKKQNNTEIKGIEIDIRNLDISKVPKCKPHKIEYKQYQSMEYDCPICFESDGDFITLECNHKVCEVCLTRLFELCKVRECPLCLCKSNVLVNCSLLKLKCQKCNFIGNTKQQLTRHYNMHKLLLCEQCLVSRYEFPSEYSLYTVDNLIRHRNSGLKEENYKGFYGHIFCIFCSMYFYDAEECKRHCRKEHSVCTICESIGETHNYYNNMTDLGIHVKEKHFLCAFNSCTGVAFPYKSELDEHMFKMHKTGSGTLSLFTKTSKSTVRVFKPLEVESGKKVKPHKSKAVIFNEQIKNNLAIPTFLERNKIRLVDKYERQKEFIQKNYSINCDELFEKTVKYQEIEIQPNVYLECVELILGGKEALIFSERIVRFFKDASRIHFEEALKAFRKKILFPSFEIPVIHKLPPKKANDKKLKFNLYELKKK